MVGFRVKYIFALLFFTKTKEIWMHQFCSMAVPTSSMSEMPPCEARWEGRLCVLTFGRQEGLKLTTCFSIFKYTIKLYKGKQQASFPALSLRRDVPKALLPKFPLSLTCHDLEISWLWLGTGFWSGAEKMGRHINPKGTQEKGMSGIVSWDNFSPRTEKEISKTIHPDNSGCLGLRHILSTIAQWKELGLWT